MKRFNHLKLEPLTEEGAKETCKWQYNPPYEVYSSWSWEKMLKENEPMTDSELREKDYLGLYDEEKNILGFVVFSNPKKGVTRLGLGLKPELCGIGLGERFVELIIEESKLRNPSNIIDLEVLSWNKRAYKVYENVGFKKVDTYKRQTPTGESEFNRMEYNE